MESNFIKSSRSLNQSFLSKWLPLREIRFALYEVHLSFSYFFYLYYHNDNLGTLLKKSQNILNNGNISGHNQNFGYENYLMELVVIENAQLLLLSWEKVGLFGHLLKLTINLHLRLWRDF